MTMMPDADTIRNRMLALIASVVVIAGLRASYSVTMPLAAATIIVAAVWPIKPWLDRIAPSPASYIGTILVLVLLLLGLMAAIYFSTAQLVRGFAENDEKFARMYASITAWAARRGFQELGVQEGYTRLVSFGQTILSNAYAVFLYLGFIAILVILGLPEVQAMREKASATLSAADRHELITVIDEIAEKIRQYLGVTALTSLLTGVAS